MATSEEKAPEGAKTAKNDPRAAAWEAFLQTAEAQNPEKFAVKKAKGEFDKIPDSFVG